MRVSPETSKNGTVKANHVQQRQMNKVILKQLRSVLGEQRHLIIDTIILGVVGALSAQLFNWMLHTAYHFFLNGIAGYFPPGLPNEGGSLTPVIGPLGYLLIPLSTTIGGLISGVLVYTFAPEAEGHGTDSAVKSFHFKKGEIRARIPLIKMFTSAITIGSGGAAGREGPTALIAAGIGSIYASFTHRTEHDRRLLTLIGMSAGLAAIFRSPIGTALFAVEVLYGGMEFEAGALLYTMLGSVVAYAINGVFSGYEPLFLIPANLATPGFVDYSWYILLGIGSGLVATLIPVIFYGVRDLFNLIPIPPHFKPAIGGLLMGLLALEVPQVISGGYGWMQMAIDGLIPANQLLILTFAMVLAFSLTIGSGGSGGVFAPSLFVGAMFGGFFARITNHPSAAFAVVGMAAVFSGAARVPLATMLMVTEMTGGYKLLVPAGLAVMLSYLVQEALSRPLKYKSLYEAQVPVRLSSPAHHQEAIRNVLRLLSTSNFSVPNDIDHIDLRNLLVAGIPIDLPDNRQLAFVALRTECPLLGQHVKAIFTNDLEEVIEVIAVVRSGHLVMPHNDPELQTGDRLLAIVTPEGRQLLTKYKVQRVDLVERIEQSRSELIKEVTVPEEVKEKVP